MSTTATRNTLTRQWELLRSLPSRAPGSTAQELTELLADAGYKVSKRTVERDLVSLSSLFPLQCNDKGEPYGWYWTPGASAELPGLTLSEALTLQLVEDSLRPLLPAFMLRSLEPRFALAREKLQALGDQVPAARWIDKIASVPPTLTLLAPEVDDELLERLQLALLEDRQLQCRYFSAQGRKTRELRLNPLALIQRGNLSYLVAVVDGYADVRLFAVHRFQQAQPLDTPCQRPADFDLNRYIADGAMQFISPGAGSIRLQAWIDAELARQLGEAPLAADMQLQAEGEGFRLSATVPDSWQLRWWLLSRTGQIVVREPQHLRAELLRDLEKGLAQYRGDASAASAAAEPAAAGA